jgi:membrane protease YdiL (CAAX protease family)
MATFRYDLLKNEQGQIRNGVKIFGFVSLIFIVFGLIALIPFLVSVKAWISVALIVAISWFCLKLEGNNLSSLGLRFNVKFLSEFSIGTLLGILIIVFAALIINFFSGLAWVRNHQINLGDLFYALIPFLAISLYEELLFRGYAFQRAVRGLGNTTALLLFGLFFIIAHWNNPGMTGSALALGSLNIGLASILLGLAWIKTGSMALPFGIHLGWNWAEGSLLGFGVSGAKSQGYWTPVFNDSPQLLTGGDFGLEAGLSCAIVCSVACVCFALLIPKPIADKKIK